MKIKKGDLVKVITGDNKNKTGKVLKVYKETNRAIVEGVNIQKRHTRPSAKNTQGGIIEKEASVHISNLMYFDSKSNKESRIGYKILVDEKTGKQKKARILKASKEMLA